MRYFIKLLSRWFAFLILFFYWSGFSLSQGYLVDHYTEMDGLPTANVHDIVQDHQGKLWFATRAGLRLMTVSPGKNIHWKTAYRAVLPSHNRGSTRKNLGFVSYYTGRNYRGLP